ncbi:MAG: DUF922 domain-containing protein [Gammaproteobacteria bacterium]|nr:DUF922 domain-containing protein [Gammaproteobacteria bacterium]
MVKRWLLVALLLALSTAAGAEVISDERIEHYLVAPEALVGKDQQALWAAVARHSPISNDGRTFAGHTRWQVRWGYQYRIDGEHCEIIDVTTELNIVITMPELFAASAGGGMDQLFAEFYRGLMAHEQLHADHGRAAAAEIDASLLGFSAHCERLTHSADSHAKAIADAWGAKDRELDRLTEHGRYPERFR